MKSKLLIVGGFPGEGKSIYGGVVTACKILIESDISNHFQLRTIDSTQYSNPLPPFVVRLWVAYIRFIKYIYSLFIFKPRLVLIFTSSGFSLLEKGLLVQCAKIFRIPVVLFPRGGGVMNTYGRSSIVRHVARLAFLSPSRILCQGQQWVTFLHKDVGVNPSKLSIISNWTATPDLLNIGSQRKYHNSKSLNVLFVGWIEKEKGVLDLIHSIQSIKTKIPIKVTFVGDGGAKHALSKLIDEYQLNQIVEIVGWQNRSNLVHFYKKSDIFVLPSWIEGLPNSLIEAMACGLAVIVTDVGNVRSVVVNRSNGLLIKPKSITDISNALIELLTKHEFRHSISKNAHNTALLNYNSNTSISKLINILHKESHKYRK